MRTDNAVRIISQAALNDHQQRKSAKRPLGCFLLTGMSDSKDITAIAVAVAEAVYGDANAVLQIDMSNYTEKQHLVRLFAFNGGFICAWIPGELDPLLERPKSLIILKDLDKVHCEFYRILTAIIEGEFIDGIGRSVGFQDSVILMTARSTMPSKYGFPTEVAMQLDGIINL